MITIIKNGKFTGTQYTKEQFSEDVQEFHKNDTWVDRPLFNIEPNEDGEIDFGEPTAEELVEAQMLQSEIQRKEAMLDGADYNGYKVSLTAEDGNGMIQVKSGFELGLTSTIVHFENGTKMPITAEDFPAFASWFVNERNKFFV